jgi:type III pantothenate kinase
MKEKIMLLVADIGNTNITVGVFDGKTLINTWNLSSDKNKTEDEYGIFLKNIIDIANLDLNAAVIASVVLPLTEKFKIAVEKYLKVPVLVVSHKTQNGIILDVENPKEVGCDRIANASATYNFYKTPAVVVDFGTATNFDIVTADGRFAGGIISPGIKMSSEAFSHFTNLLPKLKIEDINSVVGKNTVENMLSGIIIGHAAMIDGLIQRIEEEIGQPVTTISTGGYSSMINSHLKRPFDHINPFLTLEGLRIIYELNKNS